LWDLIGVLTLPGIIRYKAVVAGQMAGFAAGDPHPAEQIGWITTIGVHHAYRQMGIASALLEICEVEMKLPVVRLCVRRDNQAALRLYQKHNYRSVDVWPHYYQDGQDALVLEKNR